MNKIKFQFIIPSSLAFMKVFFYSYLPFFLSLKPRDFYLDLLYGTFILGFYLLDEFSTLFCFFLLLDLLWDFSCFFSSLLIKENYFFIFLGNPSMIQESCRAYFGLILLLGSQTNIFYIKLIRLLFYLLRLFLSLDWNVYIEFFIYLNLENKGCFSIYLSLNFLYSAI